MAFTDLDRSKRHLGAEFLGTAQLIVYVGGTLVLVVFGVMLTESGTAERITVGPSRWWLGGFLAVSMFALLVTISLNAAIPTSSPIEEPHWPGVGPIGLAFLGMPDSATGRAFLLPFELVSVHLLVVLIGAAYLARAKRKTSALATLADARVTVPEPGVRS